MVNKNQKMEKIARDQLRKIEEKQKQKKLIEKKMKELEKSGGIETDFEDLVNIYDFRFTLNFTNFLGNLFQGILNFFNKRVGEKRDKFWYEYVFEKYDIPEGTPMNFKKVEGKYKFIVTKDEVKF